MLDRKLIIFILSLTAVSLFAGIATVPNKNYYSVIHALSVGFVISSIFFFIVVYLPATQKRNRIVRSFDNQYFQFKKACISTFLIVSKSQEYQNREVLHNHEEFRRYFSNYVTDDQTRWDAIANGIQDNEYYLNELLYELRILNDEIRFVRSNIDIHDDEVFDFLNRLSQIIHRMESTQPEYEDIKSFCRFLWELFSGSRHSSDSEKKDLVLDMINRVK